TILVDGIAQDLCFQSLSIELNNNLTPQTCIGLLTSKDITPGSANISVTASLYLGDNSFQYVAKKLTNTPISIFAMAQNQDGGIGFFLPRVLLNFPDPASSGKDTQITIEMAGTVASPPAPQNQMRLYWI
ncbi:MAG: phage tail tube protein, partial [Bacteriovoracales bacterium]